MFIDNQENATSSVNVAVNVIKHINDNPNTNPNLATAAVLGALMVESAKETADLHQFLMQQLVSKAFAAGAKAGFYVGMSHKANEIKSSLGIQDDEKKPSNDQRLSWAWGAFKGQHLDQLGEMKQEPYFATPSSSEHSDSHA